MPADRPWETGTTFEERWAGYLDPDSGMLRTKSTEPIRNEADLRDFEDSRVELRAMELEESPIRGNFDLAHLQGIHRHLFQDVYEWAGAVRTVGINEGVGFLPPEHAGIVVTAPNGSCARTACCRPAWTTTDGQANSRTATTTSIPVEVHYW
ncbi:hypothetical protein ACL00T_13000 [Curtobacterium flaccumfaciens]